jgi:hypothetical protein
MFVISAVVMARSPDDHQRLAARAVFAYLDMEQSTPWARATSCHSLIAFGR